MLSFAPILLLVLRVGLAGILVAVVGATTVFAQPQTSLNEIGRVAYKSRGSLGSETAYGAGRLADRVLVWVYSSSAIFFFGAELLKAWLTVLGHPLDQLIAGARRR